MVNDILINTETDCNCWTAIHRLFMTHKTPMPIFLSLIYNILKVCTYCVSWKTNNKILSLHLLSSFYQSVFFKGKHGSNILLFTRTTTHKHTRYMLVTVIQHLMAIIKSIFLFFLQWDLVLTIHWDLSNQRAL